MSNLVVIEGVGKRETIQKYLGDGYEVFATKGHVRDLPEKTLAIDTSNNFEPKYEIMADKKAIVKSLKEKAQKSERIFLATDPDREGEAISWHIAYILNLDTSKNVRIEFNEISKNAITKAIANPRAIDINLVNAQQARRVLDRLVGYTLSPIISRKIQPKLSAGRVQSVTLQLVVDREREIQNFKPEEYWNITANLNKQNDTNFFNASLVEKDGKKFKVSSEEQKNVVVSEIQNADWKVLNLKKSVTKSNPPAPYITSSMQQDALNKLGMNLKQTSLAAQNLYEGVTLKGEGKTALITYIRTDSVRVSPQMQEIAKNFILEKYGKDYVPAKPNVFKTKQSAQDAHEAIRPIHLEITPEQVKGQVDADIYKLYKLIYERFLASQMTPATYNSVAMEIDANGYTFKATGRTPIFPGYTTIYQEYAAKDKDKEDEDQKLLPDVGEGEVLNLNGIKADQKFTKPPARYTEASLVKTMEEKGIGRPATYVPTITTLNYRQYTEFEKKFIKPTQLGFAVCDALKQLTPQVMDITFTAHMEENLDEIADGSHEWHKVIKDFYGRFIDEIQKNKGDIQISLPPEEPNPPVNCEKCGAKMLIKTGRYGKFLACSNYPNCKHVMPFEKVVGTCPKCGKSILEKTSHTGKTFFGCKGYPECDFVSWDKPINEKCPKCGDILLQKGGRVYCHSKCGFYEYRKQKEENEVTNEQPES